MKKLLVCALLAVAFTACKKTDTDKHCWACMRDVSYTDDEGTVTTTTDSTTICEMTPQEIKVYEQRYQKRILLDKTYSDMVCTQKADE